MIAAQKKYLIILFSITISIVSVEASESKGTFSWIKNQFEKIGQKTKDIVYSGTHYTLNSVNILKEEIKKLFLHSAKDPYARREATVRRGNQLAAQEIEYLQKRKLKVKQALEQLLGRSLDGSYIPKIALIGSGGGYRAMLSTTGFLSGAHEIGLLDAVTYVTALSGSTWAVGYWISTGLPIDQFKKDLLSIVGQNKGLARINPELSKLIVDVLLTKFAFNMPITLVDFYGGLLANALFEQFGNKRQQVRLSDQQARVNGGDFPLPIYTAITADKKQNRPEWYEFTPYEIGGSWLGLYVPTWAYGRLFNQGKSLMSAPEQSFGFQLGTYGSAFAITFDRLYQEIAESVTLPTTHFIMKQLLKIAGKKYLARAKVYNFTYGMSESPIKNLSFIGLADAGIAFNLPYPPVSGERPERKADILIFLDTSANVVEAPELKLAQKYAKSRGLLFPKIDYTAIHERAISIFMDRTNSEVPVVVYMPFVKDHVLWDVYKQAAVGDNIYIQNLNTFDPHKCTISDFCRTFNFSYSPQQAYQVILQSEFNMKMSKQKIVEVIEWIIQNKK